MAGLAPEGSQFDANKFDSKMNDLLTSDGQDFFTSYDEVYESFDAMGLQENLLRGIYAYGFEKPSAIQQRGIVPFCKGLDVIQQAQSGTGKTATFCSGILEQLDYSLTQCQALVLAPTRELAQQIEKVMRALGDYLGVKVHACVGGTSVREDQRILSSGVHVVVGTPGRVFDMLRRQSLQPDHIKMFVLDEADEMLSRGFKDQIYDIFQLLPSKIQVGVFSATMPPEALEITRKFMNKPVRILVKRDELTLEGIKQFYVNVGPAFLAWSRMGNLHGWGGPLPQSWFDNQLILQKKILARMYELGMTPVLPAFSGNVPAALKYIFPSAKITRLGNWFSVKNDLKWCCTYLLDATDSLFIEIGKAFIEKQLQEYGRTSHIYNCDTFDENTPPIDDPEYISSLGAAIFKGMQSGDDDAVWLMQGWLFSYDPFWRPPQMKALLHSVPVGKLVVLDLFAEVKPIWVTSEQFYGVPYIWCMLHNFAGNIEMYGILDAIASGPIDARTSINSTMVGVGMSMEGIEQNPIVYDLMSEMAFQHKKIDVKAWIDMYSTRRYGQSLPLIQEGWNVLYHTIYNCTDGAYDKNRDVIVAFPDVDPSLISVHHDQSRHYDMPSGTFIKETTDTFDRPHLWYSTSEVIYALEFFITSGDELSRSKTYRYDLVDLTRQVLAKYANELFFKVIEAYKSHDVHGTTLLSQRFLDLVEDLDTLLACHDGFLLGPWLESAKKLAQNEEQERQFEWNARTQITMWFDNTKEEASLLRDYGNKYWSGLLHDYYGPRAAIYFKYLRESLEKGKDFKLIEWRREWIKLTNEWQKSRNIFPVESKGDALITSRWLFNKYLNVTNPETKLIQE